jgi:hypothetical protein
VVAEALPRILSPLADNRIDLALLAGGTWSRALGLL